jgi:hypothetical protein
MVVRGTHLVTYSLLNEAMEEKVMEGDNRTPGKTIGEVKYAQDRTTHAKEIAGDTRASDKPISDVNDAPNSSAPTKNVTGGDNRTPEKTIGEVKYAQERAAHPK